MINRRDCLKSLAAAPALVFALPGALGAARKVAISLDMVESLKTVGGAAYLKIKEREILFIRDGEESVKAFSPVCTHKKCTVEFDRKNQKLVCPCHGSQFDLLGNAIKGPAEKGLPRYETTLSEGRIIITLED